MVAVLPLKNLAAIPIILKRVKKVQKLPSTVLKLSIPNLEPKLRLPGLPLGQWSSLLYLLGLQLFQEMEPDPDMGMDMDIHMDPDMDMVIVMDMDMDMGTDRGMDMGMDMGREKQNKQRRAEQLAVTAPGTL